MKWYPCLYDTQKVDFLFRPVYFESGLTSLKIIKVVAIIGIRDNVNSANVPLQVAHQEITSPVSVAWSN